VSTFGCNQQTADSNCSGPAYRDTYSVAIVSHFGGGACIGCTFNHLTFMNAGGGACIFIDTYLVVSNPGPEIGGELGLNGQLIPVASETTAPSTVLSNDCHVIDCTFHNVGQSIQGNVLNDHSTVYCGASNSTIAGNFFYNDYYSGQQTAGTTAIEVHGSSTIVQNNFVINYGTGVNLCNQNGDPIGTTAVQIEDNNFYIVYKAIVFWTSDSDSLPHFLQDVWFMNNWIHARPSNYPIIDHTSDIKSISGGYTDGLYIIGNQLFAYTDASCRPSPSLDYVLCSVLDAVGVPPIPLEEVVCSGTTSTVNQMVGVWLRFAKNIVINENQIFDLLSEGIWLLEDSSFAQWSETITGFEIANNLLVNLGISTTSTPSRVIALEGGDRNRPLSCGSLDGNTIDNTTADTAVPNSVVAIAFNAFSGGILSNVCISPNNVIEPSADSFIGITGQSPSASAAQFGVPPCQVCQNP